MTQLHKWEKYLEKRKQYGIKPGLERMEMLLRKLANPEKSLHVIHIAGTNGKGSSAAFMQKVLVESGYEVGFFSSPSFTGLKGHFIINEEEITTDSLTSLFVQIKPIVDELDQAGQHPTAFEIITAMALQYFKDKTDIVIIEAGMGGREDTTNVVKPLLSIITSIALDHTQFLGETIEAIAHHKAGIIKAGRPVIIGPVSSAALNVIIKEANKQQAKTSIYGKQFTVIKEAVGTYFLNDLEKVAIDLSFSGVYQEANIATSLEALFMLRELGYKWNVESLRQTIQTFSLPGRFEKINNEPVIILDSAHNPAGIKALKETLQHYYPKQTINCLFAAFTDKAIDEMINLLQDKYVHITVTDFEHERAANLAVYSNNERQIKSTSNWKHYIEEAIEADRPNDIYLITGSMHFIMQVRQWLLA